MAKKILFLFLFISPFLVKSQDIILLKNGNKLVCKILKEDSVTVYFKIEKNNQELQSFINRSEIQSINYYNPNHIKGKTFQNINIQKSNLFTFSAGVSIPRGDFANSNFNSEDAGLAGNGINFNLTFLFGINKNFGILAKGYYNTNEFKTDIIANDINSTINVNNIKVKSNHVSYSSYGALVGPSFILPVDKLSLYGYALLGFSNLTEPEAKFDVTYYGRNIGWIKLGEVNANAIIYNIGGGLIYSINSNWCVIANVDYITTEYVFGDIKWTDNTGWSETAKRGKQKYDIINPTLGFGLKF